MSASLSLGKGHATQTAPACCLLSFFFITRLFVTLNYLTFRLIAATTEEGGKKEKENLWKVDANCHCSLALSQHATGLQRVFVH